MTELIKSEGKKEKMAQIDAGQGKLKGRGGKRIGTGPVIISPNNQFLYSDHRREIVRRAAPNARNMRSASPCIPDVPMQANERIGLMRTVRDCVRVCEEREHAN